ncbi:hypothetical protein [Paenarthrobacter ureafaciens]|nr:hypothetical protein [Paenarthrobacter ureafaciens]
MTLLPARQLVVAGAETYFEALREADWTMSPDALLKIVGLIDLGD